MPRRARLLLPEIPVHVIQRGIDRAACFFSDEDRQVYLDALGGLARSCGVGIHAYVLMTNHVHLLVTASAQPNLSALIKGHGQRYVQYVNRTYHRTGTLWEGGFLALGSTPAARATAYQALFTEVLDPAWVDSLRAGANSGCVLGSDRFQRQIATLVGRRTWKGSPVRPEEQVADPAQQALPLWHRP